MKIDLLPDNKSVLSGCHGNGDWLTDYVYIEQYEEKKTFSKKFIVYSVPRENTFYVLSLLYVHSQIPLLFKRSIDYSAFQSSMSDGE
jgi:hypothetical protein